jgi:hypothetical protein
VSVTAPSASRARIANAAARAAKCERSGGSQSGCRGPRRFKNEGEASRGAGRLDPSIRGVFGQVQDLRAVREERRAPGAEIETPRIELGERGDQVGGRVALPFRERSDASKERGIRQGSGRREWRRHTSGIAWPFLPAQKAPQASIEHVDSRRPIRGDIRVTRRILASLLGLRGGASPPLLVRCKRLSSVFSAKNGFRQRKLRGISTNLTHNSCAEDSGLVRLTSSKPIVAARWWCPRSWPGTVGRSSTAAPEIFWGPRA